MQEHKLLFKWFLRVVLLVMVEAIHFLQQLHIFQWQPMQQFNNLQSSSQPPSSIQQSIADQSSQMQVPAVASSTSVVPMSVSNADIGTSSVSKSIDGTPTVTQPNTPDLLIHRKQVSQN